MYYDLLPKIKNAILARKEKITVPFSKMDLAILKSLVAGGYVKSVEKKTVGRRNLLDVHLRDRKDGTVEFKLMSKPSRRLYRDYRSLRTVKQGHGLGVLSTSKGIMSDREARKAKVGGEYLFEIW